MAAAVTIIGEPSPADAPAAFDRAWTFLALAGLAAGAVMLALYRRPGPGPAPGEVTDRGPALVPASISTVPAT